MDIIVRNLSVRFPVHHDVRGQKRDDRFHAFDRLQRFEIVLRYARGGNNRKVSKTRFVEIPVRRDLHVRA